jgi:hypothetical protein
MNNSLLVLIESLESHQLNLGLYNTRVTAEDLRRAIAEAEGEALPLTEVEAALRTLVSQGEAIKWAPGLFRSRIAETVRCLRLLRQRLWWQKDLSDAALPVGAIRDVRRFGPRREDVPEYPLPALREIITNGLAHREYQIRGARVILKWFSNRIEVSNPGELMEPITPATIYTTRPVHRNPNLMQMLYGYGYVEGYGDGLPMVRALFEEHPLRPPLPRFEEVPGSVVVTLYAADLSKLAGEELTAHWTEMGLSDRQIQAMLYLMTHSIITNREYRRLTGVGRDTAHRDLRELVRKGLLQRQGQGRMIHYIAADDRTISG